MRQRWLAVPVVLCVCVLVADLASHHVARVILEADAPQELQFFQSSDGVIQDNIKWLWTQGPEPAVMERQRHVMDAPQPQGHFITKDVPPALRLQHLGLGGGIPQELRKMSVGRQNLWTYGPAILGQNDFIADGMVPDKVPVIGQA